MVKTEEKIKKYEFEKAESCKQLIMQLAKVFLNLNFFNYKLQTTNYEQNYKPIICRNKKFEV